MLSEEKNPGSLVESKAMVTKMASSALIVLVPWAGQVFRYMSKKGAGSFLFSFPPPLPPPPPPPLPALPRSSFSTATSRPSTAPKHTKQCLKGGRVATEGSKTSPLSLVPIFRSYPPSSE